MVLICLIHHRRVHHNQRVTPSDVAVTGVTLDNTTPSVEVGKTVKVTPTIAPADATDKTITFEVTDDTVATIDNDGTITGVKAGTTAFKVKAGSASADGTITVTDTTE